MPRIRPLPPGLDQLSYDQDGVVHRKQLLALGVTEGQIRQRLSTERWKQPLPGAILLSAGHLTFRQRLASAWIWGNRNGVIAGPSAATLAGVRGLAEGKVHLLFPRERWARSPAPWVEVHSTRVWHEDQMLMHVFPARQRPAPALVLAAGLLRRPDDAVALLASGVQQQPVSAAQLREHVLAMPEVAHRRRLLAALDDIEGGAHSLPEVQFAQLCRRLRLPKPTRQAIRMYRGRRRYLDVVWEDYRITVEIDGQGHMELQQWLDDLIRGNSIGTDGHLLLRFAAQHVRLQPELVSEYLISNFEARGWQRNPSL